MSSPLLALALAGLAGGGQLAFFDGPPGGVGDVLTFPESSGPSSPVAGLQGVRLLPIDFVGRVEVDALRDDRPRLRTDVPLAARVELPAGQGSLYRFSRDEPGGELTFGLFLVGPDGTPQIVWEATGTGTDENVDPMVPRVAVDALGSCILLATTVAAGGNLLEVELADGSIEDRTASLPPTEFSVAGMVLSPTWGIGSGPTGVWRFDRSAGSQALPVPLPGAQAWFSGEIAVSANGAVAATTAGSLPTAAFVYTFGRTGAASRVTSNPAHLSGAGYLPESPYGPYLAISDDGAHVAWRTEGVTREAWTMEVPTPAPSPFQITSDGLFLDTLDEVGVLFFLQGPTLVLAVGERDNPGAGIENLDFFRVDTPSSGIENLTQSNGVSSPPFFAKPTLALEQSFRIPGSNSMLFLDDDQEDLWLFDFDAASADAGSTLLLPLVKEIDFIERHQDEIFFSLGRRDPFDSRDFFHFNATSSSLAQIASIPDEFEVFRSAMRPDGWLAFIVGAPFVGEWLARYDMNNMSLGVLTSVPLFYGPALDWTSDGTLAFDILDPGGLSFLFGWKVPSGFSVQPEQHHGFILPGA